MWYQLIFCLPSLAPNIFCLFYWYHMGYQFFFSSTMSEENNTIEQSKSNKPPITLWLQKQLMLGCFMLQPSLLELYYSFDDWLIYKLKKHSVTDRQTDISISWAAFAADRRTFKTWRT